MSKIVRARASRAELPPEVAGRLGPFYVYVLVDPRNDEPFYVGKGTGARLLAHGAAADLAREPGQSGKLDRIQAIRSMGKEPRLEIARHGLAEGEALLVEAALIDYLPALTNKVAGHGATTGRTPLNELLVRYGASPLVVTDPPALLIRLTPRRVVLEPPEELEPGYFRTSAGWFPGITAGELLDATRGWWKVNPRVIERRGVRHVVAVVDGVTRGLYAVTSWVGPNTNRRWAFTADVVDRGALWLDYVGELGRRVPFAPHSQNPVSYWPPKRAGS